MLAALRGAHQVAGLRGARRSAMFASPTSPRPITLTISSTVVTSQCSAMRLRGTFCFFTGGTCRPYRLESTRQQWGVRHSIDFRRFLPRSRRALARPRLREFFLHRRTAELGLGKLVWKRRRPTGTRLRAPLAAIADSLLAAKPSRPTGTAPGGRTQKRKPAAKYGGFETAHRRRRRTGAALVYFCQVRFLWRLAFKRFRRLCLFIFKRRFFFRLPMVIGFGEWAPCDAPAGL